MRNFKLLVLVVFLLLIMAVVVVFVLENQQLIPLKFIGWELPQLPLSVLVLVPLMVGLGIGPLLTLGVRFFSRRNSGVYASSKNLI
ncbi:hypothetical protein D3C81_550990 [compost metagenome]|nr:lipopolysaccharide assembly protein LapA domain-containing protein [Pseudomonas wadenswilerensis]